MTIQLVEQGPVGKPCFQLLKPLLTGFFPLPVFYLLHIVVIF